jgi:hypothetical protein
MTRRYGHNDEPSQERIVLFPGVEHAPTIEDTMLDGTKATYDMFQDAAKELDFSKTIGSVAFNQVFKYMLKKREVEEGRGAINSRYGQYINWADGISPHRTHIILADYALVLFSDTFHEKPSAPAIVPRPIRLIDHVLENLENTLQKVE